MVRIVPTIDWQVLKNEQDVLWARIVVMIKIIGIQDLTFQIVLDVDGKE